ncbi:fumarylacetoacetate hydrolase family protein [Ramlibacter sp. AW1]|uniref:Fumarylacetoacetate hydrolase family protein n=1 Tax=Ramlibacter aurantiacus TaxID=2801330 RepID=A0A936ZL91_9BURK|nr:fumarylacetoacetate hydrolase family protein [Ramlibacter aurantiacus]MBL0421877.1 fumarylacetoacetate hydrolase family protein [Ramlibacter aurantiacus]
MAPKLLRYHTPVGPRAGYMLDGALFDLEDETGLSDIVQALDLWDVLRPGRPVDASRLAAPIATPGQVYCAGANYVDHLQEMARAQNLGDMQSMKELGEKPWHFVKSGRSAIVGPDDVVKLPAWSQSVDWEVELVAVIGRTARDVTAAEALDHVAGYTIANDLSARDASRRQGNPVGSPFHYDWLSHKCFDGACPLGPWIVSAEEVGDPQALGIRLWVGDELMQDSHTSQMVFSVAEQIEMLSSRVTLHPGDLVLTGTPAGVGMPWRRFLQPGERVRLWVEKVGEFQHGVTR